MVKAQWLLDVVIKMNSSTDSTNLSIFKFSFLGTDFFSTTDVKLMVRSLDPLLGTQKNPHKFFAKNTVKIPVLCVLFVLLRVFLISKCG